MLNPLAGAHAASTTDRLIAWGLPLSFAGACCDYHSWARPPGTGRWALFCVSSTFVSLAQPAVGMAFPPRWPGAPCRPTTW